MARLRADVGKLEGLLASPTGQWPEALTQTYKQGAVLVLAAGYIQEAGANPVAIVGIAKGAGGNTAANGTNNMSVAVAQPGQIFEMSLDDGTATYASVQADLGKQYGITKDANGVWFIDQTKTGANSRVTIVDFKDAVGTVTARVYAKFMQSQTAFN